MPDAPDNYHLLPDSSRHVLADVGELAARQNPLFGYDRRGTVHWWDDFGFGIAGYNEVTQGADAAAAIVNADGFASGYHYLLTAGSDAQHRTYIERGFGAPEFDSWGIYVPVWFLSEFETLDVTLILNTLTLTKRAGFRISATDDEILYLNDGLTYTKIDDFDMTVFTPPTYQHFKLVWDVEDNKYSRMLVNRNEYDLSAVDSYLGGAGIFDSQLFTLYFTGRAANNDTLAIGGVVLTTGEP